MDKYYFEKNEDVTNLFMKNEDVVSDYLSDFSMYSAIKYGHLTLNNQVIITEIIKRMDNDFFKNHKTFELNKLLDKISWMLITLRHQQLCNFYCHNFNSNGKECTEKHTVYIVNYVSNFISNIIHDETKISKYMEKIAIYIRLLDVLNSHDNLFSKEFALVIDLLRLNEKDENYQNKYKNYKEQIINNVIDLII